MASQTSTLTVRLIDAVTGPARAAANSIRGIGTAVDQTNSRRLAIAGAIHNMNRDVTRATRSLQRNVQRLNTGLSMPTGFATWFGARSIYDFEKVSNAFQAVTLATREQREEVQKLAQDLNALFPYTNAQIMSAAFELGRAGFKPDQVKGILKDTLNLALAGDIDLQESADIATNVLTAMRLPMKTQEQAAESLRRVNDALSYAASNSNTDVRMMGETFKYVGPMAAAAGMSIEHVAAASMVMAKNGIRASEAGVAMRSALVRMVRPTKPMLAALSRLNVDISEFVKGGRQISAQDVVNSLMADGVDASGFIPQIEAALRDPRLQNSLSALTAHLTDIIGGDGSIMDKSKLAEAISDTLTAAGSEVDLFGFIQALREKGADLGDIARIFDARQGARLITLLSGDLLGELEKVQANAPGATDQMAGIRNQGIVGEVNAFVAGLENLFRAIADAGVLRSATSAINTITRGLKAMAEASPKLLEWGTYTLILAGALAPLGMLLGGVVGFFGTMAGLLKVIGRYSVGAVNILRAAAGLGVTAGAGGTAAGAAAGAGVAASGRGWLSTLFRGAGAIGAGWLVKDLLGWMDPKGNLWGLTSGMDAWFERNLGFNPSQVGGPRERVGGVPTEAEGRAHDLSEWLSRQAEIDARLAQIEANTHPAMRDAPNMERDNLQFERAMLQNQIDAATMMADPEGASAGMDQTMQQARASMERGFETLKSDAQRHMAELARILSVSPIITPRVSGVNLRGIHADVGID